MIFVLFTYGGWNEMAYGRGGERAAEEHPPRLLIGTLAVTAIYVLVNLAFLHALGLKACDMPPWPPTCWNWEWGRGPAWPLAC